MAIIKKYNKALQTLDVFRAHECEGLSDEDDKVSLRTTVAQMQKGAHDFKYQLSDSLLNRHDDASKVISIDSGAEVFGLSKFGKHSTLVMPDHAKLL